MIKRSRCSAICSCLVALVLGGAGDLTGQDWAYFGGDKAFTRYSALEQIDRDNSDRLSVVWRRPGVDAGLRQR